MRTLCGLVVALFGTLAGQAHADGGLVRLDGDLGPYRVVALSAPTPLVEGDLDLTVLVRDAQSGRLLEDVTVEVAILAEDAEGPQEGSWMSLEQGRASHPGGSGAIFQVWTGSWQVRLRLRGSLGEAEGGFPLPVGARSRLGDSWPWLLFVPGLLGIWFQREWAKTSS
ncbi:MAG: hypothetical protein MK085_07040 [Phycisphaerales bacterium]|nr:hypothetical protein [Phycisphaerales bacterium]